jgi:hypothetical protein
MKKEGEDPGKVLIMKNCKNCSNEVYENLDYCATCLKKECDEMDKKYEEAETKYNYDQLLVRTKMLQDKNPDWAERCTGTIPAGFSLETLVDTIILKTLSDNDTSNLQYCIDRLKDAVEAHKEFGIMVDFLWERK